MNTDSNLKGEQDLAKRIESPNSTVESKAEDKETDVIHGAELLENPPNGDFGAGLKVFSDWSES